METGDVVKKILGKAGQAVAGFLCSAVCILGYYPLIPAFAAAGWIWYKKSVFLYVGILAGMIYFMNFNAVMKYVVLVIVIAIAIGFYRWANKQCSGIAAGLIAGVATVAMNYSGTYLAWSNRSELMLGGSEGILVMGFTCLLHYLLEMLGELGHPFPANTFSEHRKSIPAPEFAGTQEGKMEALMSAVDGLSEVFTSLSQPKNDNAMEDVGALEQEITGKLCAACDGCAICWEENRGSLTQNIRDMLAAVLEHRTQEEIVERQYVQDCPQYPDMVEQAIQAFGRMELNRAWYLRLLENRQVVAQQLDAMVELMEGWSKAEHLVDDRSRLMLARIMFETKEKGLLLQDLHIYEDDKKRRYIRAMVSAKWGGGIPTRNYLQALEKATHSSLRLERNAQSLITKDWMRITVYENTLYYTLPGIAMQKKNSSSISGDNFTMFDLDDGCYFIGLSDGMGSGSRANQESELVVDLLEKLLRAGFAQEIAIRMMNSAMVLKGEDNSYSTLDLASIDLYSGELSLIKIGAAASFLKRKDEVICLTAGSLPAGADPAQKPAVMKQTVEHGDFLVMVTDGVLEYLHAKEPHKLFMDMIGKANTDNAGALAKSLLDQVLLHTGGYAQDDMTILATGIWEKS